MPLSLAELAQRTGATLRGNERVVVSRVATLDSADEGAIAFLANPKYRPLLASTRASAVIVAPEMAGDTALPALVDANPYAIFAKVAALWASKQLRFEQLGPIVDDPLMLTIEPPRDDRGTALGQVIAVDRFGNLITDLPGAWLERADTVLEIAGQKLRPVGTYAEARDGECVALISSFGLVEVAAKNQLLKERGFDAARRLAEKVAELIEEGATPRRTVAAPGKSKAAPVVRKLRRASGG